jgi:hypothetical protein
MDKFKKKAMKSAGIAKEVDSIAWMVGNLEIVCNLVTDDDIVISELEIDRVLEGMNILEDMDNGCGRGQHGVHGHRHGGGGAGQCGLEEEADMMETLLDSAMYITTTTFNIDEQARGKKRKRTQKDKVYNWTRKLCPGSRGWREAETQHVVDSRCVAEICVTGTFVRDRKSCGCTIDEMCLGRNNKLVEEVVGWRRWGGGGI